MDERLQEAAYRKEWAVEVLKLLMARRNGLREVLNLTREIGEALDRNDRVSVNMLLKMRGRELEELDGSIRMLQLFKEQLSPESRNEIEMLLQGNHIEQETPETEKILEMVTICQKLLQDTIALDQRMSRRVAGADSFYNK